MGATLIVAMLWAGLPAQGLQAEQDRLVTEDPAAYTPQVLDGAVKAIVQVGDRIIVGGRFSQVREPGGPILTRRNVFTFDADTGDIDAGFHPNVDGVVTSLAVSADELSVYVGGGFDNVNGVRSKSLARLALSTGQGVSGFDSPAMNGKIKDLRLSQGHLYVAGTFGRIGGLDRPALASLSPSTGHVDGFLNLGFADPRNGGVLQVLKMDVTADGSRLVAVGNFDTVSSQSRSQLAVVDLTGGEATLADWRTAFFQPNCSSSFDTYMRDVDISPDGAYFVVTTTGAYRGSNSPCDVTTRWELDATGSDIAPTWRNYTGGDTTYAVAITGTAVYVGGHFRWQNNPFAGDTAGPGAVPREGIAALDPVNGLPFRWNPGRARGIGVFDMLATDTGLWVGSDTDRIAWENHPKLAFLPLAGGTEVAQAVPGALPNDVHLAGRSGAGADTDVLYRVNAGGPTQLATDGGPDWEGDTAGSSPYRNSGSNAAGWASLAGLDASVPEGTPVGLFLSERWDPGSAPAMEWDFPVTAGEQVMVRLYFAAQCSCTDDPGERVFDLSIDGGTVLDDYDIVADVGFSRGVMKAFEISSDGNVDIDFGHVVENPLVNGIEIVRAGTTPPTTTTENDGVRRRHYDGSTVGATATLPDSGLRWSRARGGMMLNGTLYTGWADGNLYARDFNGSTFGTARAVDLHGLTRFSSEIQNMTGMFYDQGRLYFTLAGDSNLYYRYFTLESEVVGAQRYVATGSVPGADWSTVSGMFLSGDHLYFATRGDGNLHRIGWSDGHVAAGTGTVVSGPGPDGNDWATRAMFLYGGADATPPNQAPSATATGSCEGTLCTFSAVGSSDADGTVTSYAWDFGDGSTGTGATAEHTYATGGSYDVTLAVTDDDGAVSTDTTSVTVAVPNQPPTAAFTLSCQAFECSADGSASDDVGGSITSYAWDFGDGHTATGPQANHTYAAPGSYTVTLTVTDNDGATGEHARAVTVAEEEATDIAFVGRDVVNRNARNFTVTVPATVTGGEGMLLMYTQNRQDVVVTPPSGWTVVDSVGDQSVRTTVWQRVAAPGDAGDTATVTTDRFTKGALTLVAYRGTNATAPIAAFAGRGEDVTRLQHTTPLVDNAFAGAWRVSYWGQKSSDVSVWEAPAGESVRGTSFGSGGGHVGSLLTDSGGPVGTGPQGGLVATTDDDSSRVTMWTLLLRPATP